MGPMMVPAACAISDLVAETSGALKVLDIAAGHSLFGITIDQRNPVGGELPVCGQIRLNERVTAVVIPAKIRIVARRQSGTRTRPTFNRSSFRGVRALDLSQRRARVMPPSACDTAHDSGPANDTPSHTLVRYPRPCAVPVSARPAPRGCDDR
jgi:hypothetical protein